MCEERTRKSAETKHGQSSALFLIFGSLHGVGSFQFAATVLLRSLRMACDRVVAIFDGFRKINAIVGLAHSIPWLKLRPVVMLTQG
jgi:hypothetical protein